MIIKRDANRKGVSTREKEREKNAKKGKENESKIAATIHDVELMMISHFGLCSFHSIFHSPRKRVCVCVYVPLLLRNV